MELLVSKRVKLPILYFITDRSEIKDIPIGVPYIYGNEQDKPYIIRIMEYEYLYQAALKSGYPFNFKNILEDAGFVDMKDYWYDHPLYMDYKTEDGWEDAKLGVDVVELKEDSSMFDSFIKDSVAYVDVAKLKELNVFPVWLDIIEDAISTNIHNFATFNHNMYNKKLDGLYGGLDLVAPNRNLIIIDISGSIPKAVSSTCLTLSKNLAETFYADLLITGSKSTLYTYENIYTLDVNKIYEENDIDNDQVYFKKLLSEQEKHYKTAIVFGDNHHPGQAWDNKYNRKTKTINDEDGKKLCKWKVDKVISFHTGGTRNIAGYSRWFSPIEVEKVDNWVKYL